MGESDEEVGRECDCGFDWNLPDCVFLNRTHHSDINTLIRTSPPSVHHRINNGSGPQCKFGAEGRRVGHKNSLTENNSISFCANDAAAEAITYFYLNVFLLCNHFRASLTHLQGLREAQGRSGHPHPKGVEDLNVTEHASKSYIFYRTIVYDEEEEAEWVDLPRQSWERHKNITRLMECGTNFLMLLSLQATRYT